MTRHYYAIPISLLGMMIVGLSLNLTPQGLNSVQDITFSVSQAFAEESHSYGSDGYDGEGYDRDGHDRDGYDREGYSDDGRHRDGHHDEAHNHHDRHTHESQTEGAAQTFEGKPAVKQY